jgi:hypothetical protein
MHPDDAKFTDIITAVTAGYPGPQRGPQPSPEPERHWVIWFAIGTILWLLVAVLGYALVWLLIHG